MRHSMETVVSVSPKDQKNSARRKDVHPACVGVSALYKLEGPLSKSQVDKIARELLCDPVVETFGVDDAPTVPGEQFVDVWYKPGVMDPAGASVAKAVRDLGIPALSRASCGARYVFDRDVPDSVAKELLNPLIQERKVRQA